MRRTGIALLLLGGCATSGGQRPSDEGDGDAKGAIAEIASFRESGHGDAAVAALDRLLKRLSAGRGAAALSPADRTSFDAELEAERAFVKTIGAKECAAGRPLAGEAQLARLSPLLAHDELAEARAAVEARIRDAGQKACTRVQSSATPDAPHVGILVSRYCAHFGVTFQGPAAPDGPSTFELAGTVTGPAKGATERIRGRVDDWLRSSAWYEREGQGLARGTLRGKLDAAIERRPVTLHATYRDRVVTETGSTEQSASLPPVVRRALDDRSATSVTELSRDYAYNADEHRGRYDLDVAVALAFGTKSVTFTLRRTESLKAYDHDASFAPAGVAPRHETVPTTEEWLDRQLDRMSTKVVSFLNRKFVSTYCGPSGVSPDDAGRCVAAGQRAPAALATVAQVFGEEPNQLLAVLRPPPPPAAKPARAHEPKPKARVEEDDNPVID